jgi:hypothetical protein
MSHSGDRRYAARVARAKDGAVGRRMIDEAEMKALVVFHLPVQPVPDRG